MNLGFRKGRRVSDALYVISAVLLIVRFLLLDEGDSVAAPYLVGGAIVLIVVGACIYAGSCKCPECGKLQPRNVKDKCADCGAELEPSNVKKSRK